MKRYMPSDREREWLEDILDAIEIIEKFVMGMEFADFQDDPKTAKSIPNTNFSIISIAKRITNEAVYAF